MPKKDGVIRGFIENLIQKDLDSKGYHRIFFTLSFICTGLALLIIYFLIEDPSLRAKLIAVGGALWAISNYLHKKIDKEDIDLRKISFGCWFIILPLAFVGTLLCVQFPVITPIVAPLTAAIVFLIIMRWYSEKKKKENPETHKNTFMYVLFLIISIGITALFSLYFMKFLTIIIPLGAILSTVFLVKIYHEIIN